MKQLDRKFSIFSGGVLDSATRNDNEFSLEEKKNKKLAIQVLAPHEQCAKNGENLGAILSTKTRL